MSNDEEKTEETEEKTEGQLISESLERENDFFRKASKNHTVNPFAPDEG